MSVTVASDLPEEVSAAIAAGLLSPLEHPLGYAVEVAATLFREAASASIDFKTNKGLSLLWSWLHTRPTGEEAHNHDLISTVEKIVKELPSLAEWAQAILPTLRRLGGGYCQEERYRQAGRLALAPYRATIESWDAQSPHLYLL